MINSGKCPHCKKACQTFKIEEADASAGFGQTTWRSISFLCPSCNAILGVQIDPIALKNDTAALVVKKLKAAS